MTTQEVPSQRKLIRVTAGNLRNGHIYFDGPGSFYPEDIVGAARKSIQAGCKSIEIELDGLDEVAVTDVGSRSATGKSRNFFRGRSWVNRFFKHHNIKAGELLAMERLGLRRYRLSVDRKPKPRAFTAAEFFAGIGLVRLALERQGWQVSFANDIDPDKAEMYRQNWPNDKHLVLGDIHQLSVDTIPDCELFTASFPCNDLSIAGKWEGLNGKESSAFWGLIRILKELRNRKPQIVLLENVFGFLTSKNGKDFELALTELNKLGYSVDAFILNAVHWTPQSRVRLFVVAKLGEPEELPDLLPETETRPRALRDFIYNHPNIHWSIQQLPKLPEPTHQLIDIVERLPDNDPHWWNAKRTEYFMNQLSEKHAAQAKQMIAGRSYSYATAFRRVRNGRSMAELRTDGIAGCLRTPRGGSGRQILFKGGRGRYQVRLLTARECARLQGVPESYQIDVPLNQALFGFGDAVCVPAIEWITSQYLSRTLSETQS